MGKPAAVLGSHHMCPKKTNKVPHVGGPVVVGSPNVKISGIPAARQGDKLSCVGPPDTISSGSSSVKSTENLRLGWETPPRMAVKLSPVTQQY
ncbi:hypothetical protein ACOMICROBIO_NCLOACGD_04626 [Vibrio sp. B1ASS3]|nr:hypothetical protein ACOMICROBIO_NCLOACGD_04626 [Vibrio sp. B1ASS3]CAE6955448.1 hypothetical protein ACOMICROBIO_NCLOACGD_04626 [Vibrio sp. B1ASS3]